jgi:hypothetical protein
MMKIKKPGSRGGRRRRQRARPTPRWLLKSAELDQVAKARCLMVLSVLSGETPVTEAISGAGISRGTYYQMETRALNAMLRVLSPTVPDEELASPSPVRRILELEEKVKKLEQARRRSERLLVLTRKVVKGAPLTRRARKTSSTPSGGRPSRSSTRSPKPSQPTTTGADAP